MKVFACVLALATLFASAAPLEKRATGQATYYSQGGTAGSCGSVHSDSDYVVALSSSYSGSASCGQSVTVTNTDTGASIQATVADTCPGCSANSLDLSIGAFKALGDLDQGVLPIEWS